MIISSNLTNKPITISRIKSTIITANSLNINKTNRNNISHININSSIRTIISNSNSPSHNSTITCTIRINLFNNTQISLRRNNKNIRIIVITQIRIRSITSNINLIDNILVSSLNSSINN